MFYFLTIMCAVQVGLSSQKENKNTCTEDEGDMP